jgi:hypothetical protein
MRRSSLLLTALAGLCSAPFAAAQPTPPKATADYRSYAITLEKPQTVLVFAFWSTGTLALISPPDSLLPVLPAGVSRFPILRAGLWIAGGLPKPYDVSSGQAHLACSPQPGLLNEVRQSQSPTELPRWCTEVSSGMSTVVEGMKRPNHLLVFGADPITTPVAIQRALAGFKLRDKVELTVADLSAALERAIPGSVWWSAITR